MKYYFTHEEVGADNCKELCMWIDQLPKNSDAEIFLTTSGGCVESAMLVVLCMQQRKDVTFTTTAIGEVASAGTFIFLAGEIRRMSAFSNLMFHNVSYTLPGYSSSALNDQMRIIKSNETVIINYLRKKTKLTTKEVRELLHSSTDILFSPKEAEKLFGTTTINYA